MVARQTGVEKRYRKMRMDVLALRVNGEDYVTGGAGSGYVTTGNRWYVDSNTGDDANVGNLIDGAFATIGAAITAASANQGDIIYLLHNHAETITGVGGIALSKAGVSVVGLGVGDQRPRFLMDGATTVTCAITADDVYLENIVFASGHADVVACITTTKKNTTIVDCDFVDNTTNENFLTEIKATGANNTNDGLTVLGCRAMTPNAGGLEFIEITGDLDFMRAKWNVVLKDAATAGKFILQATGKDLAACEITDNILISGMTTGDVFIDNDETDNSGVVARNLVGHHDTSAEVTIDLDGARLFENRSMSADAAWPVAAAPGTDIDSDAVLRSVYDQTAYDSAAGTTVMPGFGRRVTKVGDVSTSTDALFNVTGKCLITLMVGEVTSVIATTTSLQLVTSTNSIILCASTDIVTDVAGTLYMVTGDYDDVLNGAQVPNADIAMTKTGTTAPFMINDDAIWQSVNGAGTGTIQWDLYYVPLEASASIASAA